MAAAPTDSTSSPQQTVKVPVEILIDCKALKNKKESV
jgi:hypothetical protein